MSKQEEIYAFWTENTGLTREVAIQQVMEKFEVTYETARTYYPKWRKEFLKPKLSPVGKPQQIIEKEYKKPTLEEIENKEYTEGAKKALEKEAIKRKKLEAKEQKETSSKSIVEDEILIDGLSKNEFLENIKAITAKKVESETAALKEEKAAVNEPVQAERNATRLKVTKTLKVEGKFINYNNEARKILVKGIFAGRALIEESDLDELIAELQELREVLK